MKSMCHDAAAELAVGDGLEADVLLHPDARADRLVLDGVQLGRVDGAERELGAGVQQLGRAEQAADVVGTERGLASVCRHCCEATRSSAPRVNRLLAWVMTSQ